MKKTILLLLLIVNLVGCSQEEAGTPVPAAAKPEEVVEIAAQDQPLAELTATGSASADTPQVEPTETVEIVRETAEPDLTATSEPPVPTKAAALEPIEVTYVTPSQMEGPYYPVDKPQDRDHDLVDFAGASGLPQGQVLQFGGVIYDANGFPVEGVIVEIWQTDANGVYLHPQDPSTASRDPNFQFYGESITGADGVYSFRTILPGLYEPRPRHIHVKIKRDGQELLTTQFYFANEIELQGNDAAMLIDTAPAEDDAGSPILAGQRDIILPIPLTAQ